MPRVLNVPVLVLVLSMVLLPLTALAAEFPQRDSPRPQTTDGVPHVQIGVEPVPELSEELLRRVEELPGVGIGPTRISLPGAIGFQLEDGLELQRPEVIPGGREFAHIHPDGSLHAALNPVTAVAAIEAGWAILHPWANRRAGWEGFVMIYTPLTPAELDVVTLLVEDSYRYVTGRVVAD